MKQIIERILTRNLYCVLLIVGTVVVVYGNSLTAYFLADDFMLIEKARNTDWTNWQSIVNSFSLYAKDSSLWWVPKDIVVHFFRPLVSLSFLVDYLLWGMNPFGFHLTNLLGHILASILVFLIINSISKDKKTSLLGSLLFALHPGQGEAVLWISARCDLFCGLFYFTSFFCFLKYRKINKTSWLAGSLLAFILALGSKEMAVTLPLVIILYDLLDQNSKGLSLAKKVKSCLCFLSLLFGFFLFRFIIFGGIGSLPAPYFYNPAQPGFIFEILRNIASYLTGLIFGINPIIWIPLFGIPSIVLLVLFSVALLLIFLILRFIKGTPDILFACLWILITLLPVLVIMPFERFLYIPSLGFVIMATLFLLKLTSSQRKSGLVVLIGLLLGYAFFNILQCTVTKLGSSTLQKVVKDVESYYPTLPDNSTLYFVNLSPAACMSTSQCFRLEYDNPTISAYVLTMSPNFGPRCDSYLKVTNTHTLIVGLTKGSFFDNPLAQFFLMGRHPIKKGEIVEWEKMSATVTKTNKVGAREILFNFKDGLHAPGSYFFEFKDWHVYPLLGRRLKIIEKEGE